MKTFYQKVNRRSRAAMTEFLKNHFRYDTMNSWNRSTSYAHNMKIGNLGLTNEQDMKLLELMECEDAYNSINGLISEFGRQHNWQWQARFNGRSGGYLVLYQGETEDSEYKSYCTVCGQQNYKSVAESNCRCGRCGQETRVDYVTPPRQIFMYPGRDVDMNEDFEDWSMDELKERVQLVEEFDKLADKIVSQAAYIADNYVVKFEEHMVPVTRKVMEII